MSDGCAKKAHATARVYFRLDAANELALTIHRLVAENRPLRGCGPRIGNAVQNIVDSDKHVEHRVTLAAKRGFLFKPIFVGFEIGK